jgi:hypothetical protein
MTAQAVVGVAVFCDDRSVAVVPAASSRWAIWIWVDDSKQVAGCRSGLPRGGGDQCRALGVVSFALVLTQVSFVFARSTDFDRVTGRDRTTIDGMFSALEVKAMPRDA